jgi:hypothetical protein
MSGPTIYAQLLDAHLDGPRRELRESVERFIRNGGLESLVWHYEEALKAAYIAGVSDGFQQGIARQESERAKPAVTVTTAEDRGRDTGSVSDRLSQERLEEIRRRVNDVIEEPPGRWAIGGNGSHWAECWRSHADCMASWLGVDAGQLLAEVARLSAELEAAKKERDFHYADSNRRGDELNRLRPRLREAEGERERLREALATPPDAYERERQDQAP